MSLRGPTAAFGMIVQALAPEITCEKTNLPSGLFVTLRPVGDHAAYPQIFPLSKADQQACHGSNTPAGRHVTVKNIPLLILHRAASVMFSQVARNSFYHIKEKE
ncbi:hypothetical protein GCM10007207_17800 [Asaia siamensis]|uniref:Uncharacterized protein n=1 Tax=Asaia siamensis TaxID=110479 RepID=A0ABQ1M1G5_9PROT|nr:hypothetical protein AA0323_2717 [Asaia siamensis NRIC 0323]GGC32747.1 hypothetical protein GCM10007207_17800 [Asaia siamensis]